MTTAGRATLTQSTLSVIPMHISICCSLSPWAIRAIDKRRCAFLWAGSKSVAGGRCKVAWPIVCLPREHGGLGLPDLSGLGFALCLHWEWIRQTQPDAICAHLPSRPECAVDQMFRASVIVQVGDGAAARFWTDSWLPRGAIYDFAPNLFRAVACRRRRRTVKDALANRQWARDITGAPTAIVLYEYVTV